MRRKYLLIFNVEHEITNDLINIFIIATPLMLLRFFLIENFIIVVDEQV